MDRLPARRTRPLRLIVPSAARHWSTATVAVLIVALGLVAGVGILPLQRQAVDDRRTQLALSDLGRQTNLLSSLEWRARAVPQESKGVRKQIASLVVGLHQAEEELLRSQQSQQLGRLISLARRFRGAVVAETAALVRGDLGRAMRIEEQVVDPTFDRLQPVLDRTILAEEAAVRKSLRLSDYGSIAFMLVVAAVLLGLVHMLSRSRQRTLEARAVALHEQAHNDALTELPNRRQLLEDLHDTLGSGEESLFALLDLDGFKAYNDAFGHVEGDLLLRRLASKLADAVAPTGRAYRLGGDEFCVLWLGAAQEHPDTRLDAAAGALSERGEGFSVTAARGSAALPAEARTADDALRIVDQRMYTHKFNRASATKEQVRNVALRVIAEREGELYTHVKQVARLAVEVGQRVGLAGEDLRDLTYGAELHDVGKTAIPDSILHKAGPLDEDEWEFMRRHTLIGEAILLAAPALRSVATYVRSSHERYDGGGYPDGLSGTDIPLASRVIFVCDSFTTMTHSRPYRAAMTVEQAREELLRCAGSQFDPEVVDALCEVLDQREQAGGQPSLAAAEPSNGVPTTTPESEPSAVAEAPRRADYGERSAISRV